MNNFPLDKTPSVRAGRLEHFKNHLGNANLPLRHVDVWLPVRYDLEPDLHCRVLYMHDAQNLFDPEIAYGGETWGIAEALTQMVHLEPMMVVGIWNSLGRWRDYYPKIGFDRLEPDLKQKTFEVLGGEPNSAGYADAIVNDLKPWVDAHYRTLPSRKDTFIMGSSMGGLISLYTLTKHPDVFAGAGCLSTHWLAGENAMVDALAANLPSANQHRLYFDYGTITLDEGYEPFQQRMDRHLQEAGWDTSHYLTKKFIGAAHNETAWRSRLEIPLNFLLT
jgi:predicted alpha/beta superfamily hydrolase